VDTSALDLLSRGAKTNLVREQVSRLRGEHTDCEHDPGALHRHGSR
jgi:hypothetical protein